MTDNDRLALGRPPVVSVEAPQNPPPTTISISAGFGAMLRRLGISLAFTSYQTGQLFLVGVEPDGKVSIDQQRFERAMGVHWWQGRLFLATGTQIIRFENMLLPGELGSEKNDAIFVPRLCWTTGDVDAHELAVNNAGRPLFVATRFNCVATVDDRFSFRPIWMPDFVSGSDKGDKCHLNGLVMEHGELAFATATAKADTTEGWREQRANGGMIIDCRTGATILSGLSMPHSPRLHDGNIWCLESGAGLLLRIDRLTGERREIAFCPGFARGLSLGKRHSVVTVSKPRDKRFDGLALQEELAGRQQEAWCGVLVIDLETGAIVAWLRLEGFVQELFDVVAMPGIKCPVALGLGTKEIWDNVRPAPRPEFSSDRMTS